jgi:hypothetical protein
MLIYHGAEWEKMSKDEKNRVHEACGAWHEEIVKSGNTRGAVGLQPISTATSVRQKNGRAVVTDGPFAETKEVLGGFEILDCESLDEALVIAKRFPALQAGATVELRPLVTGGNCREG